MKFLYVNGYFKLPDDFKGKFADALRLFADYHEAVETAEKREVVAMVPDNRETIMEVIGGPFPTTRESLYEAFLKVVATGRRFLGAVEVAETDGENFTELDTLE